MNQTGMYQQRVEAEGWLRERVDPAWIKRASAAGGAFAIVLGSGLGALADKIESAQTYAFADIPGFAASTAGGHRGQLLMGEFAGRPVVAMAGRLHRYEGWSNEQVSFPIGVMHSLGANSLIASNAAGGVKPGLKVGDVLVIRDHIDWLHARCSGGGVIPVALPSGRRGVYSDSMAREALAAARGGGFTALEGTYLATLGPSYETRAEYRMMRRIGADVVGMSTVPEVLTASRHSMSVLALSIVSNVADPDRAIVADHAEVLQAGDQAADKLEKVVRHVIEASGS